MSDKYSLSDNGLYLQIVNGFFSVQSSLWLILFSFNGFFISGSAILIAISPNSTNILILLIFVFSLISSVFLISNLYKLRNLIMHLGISFQNINQGNNDNEIDNKLKDREQGTDFVSEIDIEDFSKKVTFREQAALWITLINLVLMGLFIATNISIPENIKHIICSLLGC